MVTTSGNLFHIDFGHFLGHIKYFMVGTYIHRSKLNGVKYLWHIHTRAIASLYLLYLGTAWLNKYVIIFLNGLQGFKREWAPFVLTPDFVYVMGGEVMLYTRQISEITKLWP